MCITFPNDTVKNNHKTKNKKQKQNKTKNIQMKTKNLLTTS